MKKMRLLVLVGFLIFSLTPGWNILASGGVTLSQPPPPVTPPVDLTLNGSLPQEPAPARTAPVGGSVPAGVTSALLDDFNRADGPVGPNWTVHDGFCNVSSNAAVCGNMGRATFNAAPGDGNSAEADIAVNGTDLEYTGLLLNYGAGAANLFIKVQNQSGGLTFGHAACYTGKSGPGFGLGFFALDSPFATAHMAVTRVGNDVTIKFTNVDGGAQSDQQYVCTGAPAPEGTGIGIIGYAGTARLDNFGIPDLPPDIEVTPASIDKSQPADVSVLVPLSIANLGGETLNWYIYEAEAATKLKMTGGVPLPIDVALSKEKNFTPPAQTLLQKMVFINPLAPINDGSFENGPPPLSAWFEYSDTGCEWIGDFSGIWGVAAYDGSNDYWAGGYCGGAPTTSYVSQPIAVPALNPILSFWYLSYRPDYDDFDDHAYVSVNDTEVWTLDLTQANDSYPNWVNAVVDLSAYAGQSVMLKLGAVSAGDSTGNIRFDYIGWVPPAACDVPEDIPWLSVNPVSGTIPFNGISTIDVTLDSTGLARGTYSANLCVSSNDPDEPWVVVPVSLTVEIPYYLYLPVVQKQ